MIIKEIYSHFNQNHFVTSLPMNLKIKQNPIVQRIKPGCQIWSLLTKAIPKNMKMIVSLVALKDVLNSLYHFTEVA